MDCSLEGQGQCRGQGDGQRSIILIQALHWQADGGLQGFMTYVKPVACWWILQPEDGHDNVERVAFDVIPSVCNHLQCITQGTPFRLKVDLFFLSWESLRFCFERLRCKYRNSMDERCGVGILQVSAIPKIMNVSWIVRLHHVVNELTLCVPMKRYGNSDTTASEISDCPFSFCLCSFPFESLFHHYSGVYTCSRILFYIVYSCCYTYPNFSVLAFCVSAYLWLLASHSTEPSNLCKT